MGIAANGYDFVAEVAPRDGDILVPKKHPSAFFGTPLASYLVEQGADTVVVTGCTTSGCVRGSVVDAFAYNFRVAVPHDAVYDRSATSHAVNLFDMAEKYADVSDTAELLGALAPDSGTLTTVPVHAIGHRGPGRRRRRVRHGGRDRGPRRRRERRHHREDGSAGRQLLALDRLRAGRGQQVSEGGGHRRQRRKRMVARPAGDLRRHGCAGAGAAHGRGFRRRPWNG